MFHSTLEGGLCGNRREVVVKSVAEVTGIDSGYPALRKQEMSRTLIGVSVEGHLLSNGTPEWSDLLYIRPHARREIAGMYTPVALVVAVLLDLLHEEGLAVVELDPHELLGAVIRLNRDEMVKTDVGLLVSESHCSFFLLSGKATTVFIMTLSRKCKYKGALAFH